jgi:hypothetical protein
VDARLNDTMTCIWRWVMDSDGPEHLRLLPIPAVRKPCKLVWGKRARERAECSRTSGHRLQLVSPRDRKGAETFA